MVAFAFAVLVLGAAATASARPKNSAERTTTSTTMCGGTPIIIQGMDCPARGEEPAQKQPTERAERPLVTTRAAAVPTSRRLYAHHR
jgi:hypothetical protein